MRSLRVVVRVAPVDQHEPVPDDGAVQVSVGAAGRAQLPPREGVVEAVEHVGQAGRVVGVAPVAAVHVDLVGQFVQHGRVAVAALHRVAARLDDALLAGEEVILLHRVQVAETGAGDYVRLD